VVASPRRPIALSAAVCFRFRNEDANFISLFCFLHFFFALRMRSICCVWLMCPAIMRRISLGYPPTSWPRSRIILPSWRVISRSTRRLRKPHLHRENGRPFLLAASVENRCNLCSAALSTFLKGPLRTRSDVIGAMSDSTPVSDAKLNALVALVKDWFASAAMQKQNQAEVLGGRIQKRTGDEVLLGSPLSPPRPRKCS
jgi:hypothetical protein